MDPTADDLVGDIAPNDQARKYEEAKQHDQRPVANWIRDSFTVGARIRVGDLPRGNGRNDHAPEVAT